MITNSNKKGFMIIATVMVCSVLYDIRERDVLASCGVTGSMNVTAELMQMTTNRLLKLPLETDNLRTILDKRQRYGCYEEDVDKRANEQLEEYSR